MIKKTITLLAATLMMTCGMAQAAQENVDYEVLKQPIPQLQKDKIEVLEFFSYTCAHCYHLDPILLKQTKSFASDTYLRPVHVYWDDSFFNLEKIAAAVNTTGLKQQADMPIFNAIFQDRLDLSDPQVFRSWAAKQTAFDGAKLLKAYDSLDNTAKATEMKNLSVAYNIDQTPLVIVGGKYQMIFPDGFEAGMKSLNEVIEKVRKERNMKAAVMPEMPKGMGAALAASANY